jgi:phosphatidylglycerol:prolipoprotein diacylglycerol transferase
MPFHWNVEPEIIKLGPLAIRYYSLLFGLAFMLDYFIFEKFFKKAGYKAEYLDDLLMYIFVAVVVGSRLGHVIFYGNEDNLGYNYYYRNPIEILKVWKGGLASHGALAGIVIAVFLFIRKHPQFTYWWILDRIAIVAALSGTLIRIGNFFNSEIVGKYTDGSWGVVFMQNNETMPRIPIMLFESFSYFLFFIWAIRYYYKKDGNITPGFMTSMFFTVILALRFFWEFFKESDIIAFGMNQGQLLSIPVFIVGIFLMIYTLKKQRIA